MSKNGDDRVDPWEIAEDRCRVCDRLIGIGIRALHLGVCEEHQKKK